MNNSEEDTYQKRVEILKKLVKKDFPSEKIYFKDSGIISVERPGSITEKERSPRIDFNPDYDFMTDSDSNYEEVFNQGIQKAKQILEDPPLKNRNFQGEILLIHEGAIFKAREES
jgi:preprotein translocase subunit SecB